MLRGCPQPVNAYIADMDNQTVAYTGMVTDYFQNCSCCDSRTVESILWNIYTHMLYMLPLLASVTYAGILL